MTNPHLEAGLLRCWLLSWYELKAQHRKLNVPVSSLFQEDMKDSSSEYLALSAFFPPLPTSFRLTVLLFRSQLPARHI